MSGVYIDGMEMPKKGHTVTITILPTGEACVDHYDCRPQLTVPILYSAIPVPDHGRLGDLDKLVAAYDVEHVGPPGRARDLMIEASTVIPASGEKEYERK